MGRRGRHDGRASERADRVYKRGKKYEARGKMPPIWFINKCGSDSIYLMKEKLIVSIFSGYWMSFSLLGGLECLSIRCLPILTREVNLNYASLPSLALCMLLCFSFLSFKKWTGCLDTNDDARSFFVVSNRKREFNEWVSALAPSSLALFSLPFLVSWVL